MVMITLGTGVGSGIIENGRLVRGAYGTGSELGHMAIRAGGEKCNCGRSGCLEAYASATALIRQTKAAMKADRGSDMWKAAPRLSDVNGQTAFLAKDATAKKVVSDYLGYLSEGIVNIVNVQQPEIICIGGGVSAEGDRILKPLNKAVAKYSFARFGKRLTAVTRATLGNDAGIIGAALLWKNSDN
jgi:glucokinase